MSRLTSTLTVMRSLDRSGVAGRTGWVLGRQGLTPVDA
jgi:hypothetical protein